MPVLRIEETIKRFGPSLEILARIKKGDPKTGNAPGRERPHFRFAPTNPNQEQAQYLAQRWEAAFPAPCYRFGPVFLAEQVIDDVLEFWQERHVQTMMLHRCDGQKCVMLRNRETGQMEYFDHLPHAERPDCPGSCDLRGRLRVAVPALNEVGIVVVDTGSEADYYSLKRSLLWYEEKARRWNLTLQDIPFIIERKEVKIPYAPDPSKPMKKIRSTHWAITIKADPTWDAASYQAIQAKAMAALSMRDISVEEGNKMLFDDTGKVERKPVKELSAPEIVESEIVEPDPDPEPSPPEWDEEIVKAGEEADPAEYVTDIGEFYKEVRKVIPFFKGARSTKLADIISSKAQTARPFEEFTKTQLMAILNKEANKLADLANAGG